MKIGIIGGGASGLVAAIFASGNADVTILERNKRVGKKILATGNGRCNLTNLLASAENYHGNNAAFVGGAIKRWWVSETLDFFSDNGLAVKEEDNGKIYPYSDSATSVLDVLRRAIDRAGAEVVCGFDTRGIRKRGGKFVVSSYGGEERVFDRVIIATGGKAAPNLGTNGSGYALLEKFGHRITKLSPSLVQLKTNTEITRTLKGIKVNAAVKVGDKTETGELLFTDYGLSGPTVFSLSAYAKVGDAITADIMPEYDRGTIYQLLKKRVDYMHDVPIEDFFTGLFTKRVGMAVLKSAGIAPLSRLAMSLTAANLNAIIDAIKGMRFTVTGTMSWNNAQVTRGGADTSQFNAATMESKLCSGLFACGEVLDIDGDCGGYNLQWAWSSGCLAGKNAAKMTN